MPLGDAKAIRERIGLAQNPERFRGTLMFGDPFTTPVTRLLPAISNCGTVNDSPDQSSIVNPQSSIRPVPVLGGMASGASQPGLNVMVVNDRAISAGAVGVGLAGDFNIDFVLSQGCRPIGEPLVITRCRQNLVLELGGRKAMEVLQEMAQALSDADKRLLSRGLLVGTVINEYKQRFGRGDFLVRNVMGFDQRVGGIAIGEMCKVGQTIQFHVRDANTATEDLQLLLDAQMVKDEPPFAAMLFTCNGRGNRLFGESNHDVNIIRRRFGGDMPLAGFFAAGEFGPIGGKSYLHGHTASLALLRASHGE
jgi:small ligand-binding sensory domain FIST